MNTFSLKSIRLKADKSILVLVAMLLHFGVAWGQGKYPCPSFNLKKHQFGFGVSTALFDNADAFNVYLLPVRYTHRYYLSTIQSSFYALYLDYQYRFNDSWSLETRLKYKHRHTIQELKHPHGEGYLGIIGSINTTYHDLAVPVTMNYRWVTRVGSSVEIFAGAGVSTLGLSKNDDGQIYSFNDYPRTRVKKELRFDRSIDLYGILGFQFEIPYGVFTLKPFVSLSFSPVANGRYYITPLEGDLDRIKEWYSRQMHFSELECGIIMQF